MDASPQLMIRLVVLLVVAGYLQVGPVTYQLLHLKPPMFAMGWTMYSKAGNDLCTVAWHDLGTEPPAPIDRRAVLGLPPRWEADEAERFLRSEAEVRAAGAALCAALPAGARVGAVARCPDDHARWVQVLDGTESLCP